MDELQPLILPLVRPRAPQLAIRVFATRFPLALVRIQVHPIVIFGVAVLVELDAVAGG